MSAQRSLSCRRSSGASLVPLIIPPPDDSEPVRHMPTEGGDVDEGQAEVVEEGKELFQNFIHEQIQKETSVDVQGVTLISSPQGYKNPLWAKAGRDLREMADQFARTEERRRVRQRAQQMGVNVSYEQFKDLLAQLFDVGGVTRERIVVLFFFCSDVAISALRVGRDLFMQFLEWSLNFIIEHVCTWVHRHGGWGHVLRSPFNSRYKVFMWITASVFVYFMFRYFRCRRA